MFSHLKLALCLTLGLSASANLAAASPEFWSLAWPKTNFEETSVASWTEILSGGPPKDGIPAIDGPGFIPAADETRIPDNEPVITLEIDGATPRAYPIRYLTWHEIVNDEVGGIPVAVTFCPLCNSALTFDRRIEQGVVSFGVSGKLRNSDMIMYDRETESWWQQAIGEAIVGDLNGTVLTQMPSWMESWADFRARNPQGEVMDQPAYGRNYGANPYWGYDTATKPFLYNGEMPPHDIPPLARVVRVGDRAWPMERLRNSGEISEAGVVISWAAGQASALDDRVIADSQDVGSIRVRDGAGADLPHDVMFAFAYHAFWPEGEWMLGQ